MWKKRGSLGGWLTWAETRSFCGAYGGTARAAAAIFALALASVGCAGSERAVGISGGDASGEPGASLGGGEGDSAPRLSFDAPSEETWISGDQSIVVRVVPEALAERITKFELNKLSVEDTDADAGVFVGVWDTRSERNGEVTLRATATLEDGTLLQQTHTVRVYNARAEAIEGGVYLTSPVAGARVDMLVLDDNLEASEVRDTVYTSEDGAFSFSLEEPFEGSLVLIRAYGASAKYLLPSGEKELLGHGVTLTMLWNLDNPWDPEGVSVNGISTLGTTLARAYRRAYPDWSAAECHKQAHNRLGDHIWRPNPYAQISLSIPFGPFDSGFQPNLSNGMLGIVHMGLAELAKDWTADLALEERLRVGHVVMALERDLTNALFDGLERSDAPGGIPVPVLLEDSALLDSRTTRDTLADACYRSTAEFGSAVDQTVLFAEGGLYHNLATDNGPLYPLDEAPPEHIAPLGPGVAFQSPTPPQGTTVSGDFLVGYSASDNVGLASVRLELSQGPEIADFVSDPEVAPPIVSGGVAVSSEKLLQDVALWLKLEATDSEGVQTAVQRDLWLDRQIPSLALQSPIHGFATNQAPITLTGQVQDEPAGGPALSVLAWKGDPAIEAPLDAQTTTISAGGAFALGVLPKVEGTDVYTVRVRDSAGFAAQSSVQVTYDTTPPLLDLQGQSNVLWTSESSTLIAGTIIDTLGGPSKVEAVSADTTVSQAVTGSPSLASFTLELPATETTTAWSVRGVDRAGNQSADEVIWTSADYTAPELTVAQPTGAPHWTNQSKVLLSGTVFDAGSGVQSVYVQRSPTEVPIAVSALSVTPVPGKLVWSHELPLPMGPGGTPIEAKYDVKLYAVDKVGHQSATAVVPIQVDVTPPKIVLADDGYGFADEDKCLLKANGELDCGEVQDSSLSSMAGRCNGDACGVLTKYRHLLGHGYPADAQWSTIAAFIQNWPLFLIQSDASEAVAPETTFRFRFPDGSETAPSPYLPDSGIPVAIPAFAPGTTELPTAETPLPNAVIVRTEDVAGNVTERTFTFELRLVAPAPISTWLPESTGAITTEGKTWSLTSLTAHLPFSPAPSAQGLRVGTLELFNPLEYPIGADVESTGSGTLAVTLRSQRTYGEGEAVNQGTKGLPTPWTCGESPDGACRYVSNTSAELEQVWGPAGGLPSSDQCFETPVTTLSTTTTDVRTLPLQPANWIVKYRGPGGASIDKSGESVVIPPKATVFADVFVSLPGTCWVEAPAVLSWLPKSGKQYLRPAGLGCAVSAATLGAADDLAWCDVPDGPCPAWNPPPCKPDRFVFPFPALIESVRVSNAPGVVEVGTWQIEGSLPGFQNTAPGSSSGPVAVDVTISQELPGEDKPW
jgi:hypothetical protein